MDSSVSSGCFSEDSDGTSRRNSMDFPMAMGSLESSALDLALLSCHGLGGGYDWTGDESETCSSSSASVTDAVSAALMEGGGGQGSEDDLRALGQDLDALMYDASQSPSSFSSTSSTSTTSLGSTTEQDFLVYFNLGNGVSTTPPFEPSEADFAAGQTSSSSFALSQDLASSVPPKKSPEAGPRRPGSKRPKGAAKKQVGGSNDLSHMLCHDYTKEMSYRQGTQSQAKSSSRARKR